jgi:putative ABC transport system permease protein
LLISATSLGKDFGNNWGNFGFYTYVLLNKNTTPKQYVRQV